MYNFCKFLDSSDGELINVGTVISSSRLTLRGEFHTKYLSPEATYEVAYRVMLPSESSWVMHTTLCFPGKSNLTRRHNGLEKPIHTWVELYAGKFKTYSGYVGNMSFSLEGIKAGVKIRGVIIKPKLKAPSARSNVIISTDLTPSAR